MIYLLTGTPGHGKTQRAIWMLLNDVRFKDRPVLFANVRGLNTGDERLKNWIPLTDVTQWETAPQGAVIFIDECHQAGFFPLRGVGKPPPWIEALATHRHLGLDFVLVTQNAKNMDVFVRRLVELHIHVKRPAQMPYTNVYEFQGHTDCDERIPVDSALRHSRWQLDKSIWTLYKSADEHTAKAKVPRVAFVFVVLALGLGVVLAYMYRWVQTKQSAKAADVSAPLVSSSPLIKKKDVAASKEPISLSRMSPVQLVEHLMHETRDFELARVPLVADFPESAPFYEELRKVKTFPRVAGCAQGISGCRCVDQQGTPVRLSPSACADYVINGRFDPYRDDKRELGERSVTNAAPVVPASSGAGICSTFGVFGIGGSYSLETRCTPSTAAALPVGVPVAQIAPATSGAGVVGEAGGMGTSSSARAGGAATFADWKRGGPSGALQ